MTGRWTSPDARPRALGTTFAPEPAVEPAPPWWQDAWAALLTVVVSVLVGAPVGLLWASLAPRALVVVGDELVQVRETFGDASIAVDGYFVAAALVAGVVGGVLAQRLGRVHGPAVVVGLAAGGLAGAWVAMAVGEMVGADEVRRLVALEREGPVEVELAFRLRATPALAAWPVASLLTHLLLSVRSPSTASRAASPAVS